MRRLGPEGRAFSGQAQRERVRVPPPVISRRLPSGRGATEQPNAKGDGDAELTGPFWVALVLTGVATGLFGDLLMLILFTVQHAAFGYHTGDLEHAVVRASDTRRIVCLVSAGALGGPLWFVWRRVTRSEKSDVEDALWSGDARLSFRRCLGSGLISEVVIGMGASLGREQAPRVMGAAAGSLLSERLRLTEGQRRLLVACGAGAGLAAVYNVPLGGAFITMEVMLGTMALPAMVPAIACAVIATATAWLYLPTHATYVGIPDYHFTGTILVFSLVAGSVIGFFAIGYIRLIGWVSHHRLRRKATLVGPIVAFGALGLVGFAYPQLFGNGKDMAHDAFLAQGSVTLLFALFTLKPLVTALCLGSGATGGLFTPTLSTGAVLGAFLGIVWTHVWAGSSVGAFAVVGAAAMIGASMQAPLSGLVLVLELTHSGFGIVVPMIGATILATLVVRRFDGYSIYTARLSSGESREEERVRRADGGRPR